MPATKPDSDELPRRPRPAYLSPIVLIGLPLSVLLGIGICRSQQQDRVISPPAITQPQPPTLTLSPATTTFVTQQPPAPGDTLPYLRLTQPTSELQLLNAVVQWSRPERELGMSLALVSPSLRAQLGLPETQGLVVSATDEDGPAARAGLLANDILLSLDKTPVASVDELVALLREIGDRPAPLELIRNGKRETVEVRAESRVTFATPGGGFRLFMGVQVSVPDATLRTQLGLPDDRGLVVDQVIDNTPAERAGVKLYDVLTTFDGKPLPDNDALVAAIHAVGTKPAKVELIRAGKPITVEVTPERQELPEGNPVKLGLSTASPTDTDRKAAFDVYYQLVQPDANQAPLNRLREVQDLWNMHQGQPMSAAPADAAMAEEVKALRQAVAELRELLDAQQKSRTSPDAEPKP